MIRNMKFRMSWPKKSQNNNVLAKLKLKKNHYIFRVEVDQFFKVDHIILVN
jgi:hypothetical protein